MLELHTPRLVVRTRTEQDAASLCAYYTRNKAHFEGTDPPRPEGFYTEAFWRKNIADTAHEYAMGTSLRTVFALNGAPGHVVGAAALTQVQRGPFLAAYLGYSLDANLQGQGLMTEGLRALIQHAFSPMGLHRIMANYLPENVRSAGVLARLGFEREGLAKNYLYVGGAWRDHVLTALVNPDPACVPQR